MAVANEHAAESPINADGGAEGLAPPVSPERARSLKRFASRVFMVLAPVHLYVGLSLLADLPVDQGVRWLGAALLALSLSAVPLATLSKIHLRRQASIDRLIWAAYLILGFFSSLLILALVRDIALFVPALEPWTGDSAVIVVGVAVLVTLVGLVNARRVARVVRVDIPISNLPPALDGLTIAQISDVHVGSTIKRGYVQGIVERVNGLDPDVIAITGDVVDGSVSQLSADTAPLADLSARHGVFAVTGNHEYYSGAAEWITEFERLGQRVLRNEHVVIDHDGAALVIAGVNDYSVRQRAELGSDPAAAAAGSPDGAPKILLAHQPRSAEAANDAGFDLQLSGHTHGGQFWPWNHFVRMQQPYTAGLHRHGALQVYTSRGTGYWGPPKRFGAPSEIALLRLTAA